MTPEKVPGFEADIQLLRKIFSIRVDYDGEIIVVDGQELLTFSDNIDEDRNTILLSIQWVGGILSETEHKYEDMKIELDALKGRLDHHARDYVYGKKATDEKAKHYVLKEPEFVNNSKKLVKQHTIVRRLKILLGALKSKKDLLVEKGADRRIDVQYEAGLTKLPRMKGEQ